MRLAVQFLFVYHATLGYLVVAVVEVGIPQRLELTPDVLGCEKLVYRRQATKVPHLALEYLAVKLHDIDGGGGEGVVHIYSFIAFLKCSTN